MKNYEFIEHTADIGIRVCGANLEELFSNAALAMFDIIADKKSSAHQGSTTPVSKSVKLKAESIEELLVDWLNEMLSLSAIKELIFFEFKIKKIQGNSLKAKVVGQNIKDYQVNTEIKSATYHQLKIEETVNGWLAEVIFDV